MRKVTEIRVEVSKENCRRATVEAIAGVDPSREEYVLRSKIKTNSKADNTEGGSSPSEEWQETDDGRKEAKGGRKIQIQTKGTTKENVPEIVVNRLEGER